MTGLSKSRIIAHRQCPKRLWLKVFRPELADEDAAMQSRLAAGTQAGEAARTLHPQGLLIDTGDLTRALEDTASAMNGRRRPLFEATFQAGGVLVQLDLLLPARGGYRLVEVKSSTKVKSHHTEDAAVQAWVARKAGVPVKRVEIAHIDSSFVYPGGGNYEGLFVYEDMTSETEKLVRKVPGWIRAAQATLAGGEPDIEPGEQCSDPFACPFSRYCSPQDDGYPPEILPRGKSVAKQLRHEGYDDLRKVPKGRLGDPRHQRIWRVTKSGRPELDREAGMLLKKLGQPRYYLDFETLGLAVPIWAGTHPYEQVPFQWSCNVERRTGRIEHRAFLSDGPGDPRRACAESLVKVLGERGPIFVYYASFERGRMLELAEAFPDLAPELRDAVNRIVDLHPLALEHYYHRDMRGSWSLKSVLPTIASELSYEHLEVADGGMAQQAFAEMLASETTRERRDHLRKTLLEYCERDTWGMVRLAHFFQGRGHA
jgi:hypothetical protein